MRIGGLSQNPCWIETSQFETTLINQVILGSYQAMLGSSHVEPNQIDIAWPMPYLIRYSTHQANQDGFNWVKLG